MENTIYIGLSKQLSLQRHMELLANNIANIDTPGYRAQNMVFAEFVADPRGIDDPISQLLDFGQYQDTRPGSLTQTGNRLDVAIEGQGYFGVQTAEGLAYTRNGRLSLNVNGELITASGLPITDDGGNAIQIPRESREVIIAEDGTVSTENGEIARLKLVTFENQQELESIGDNLFRTDAAEIIDTDSRVVQGAYENSNVQGVLEMTRMIETSRDFASIANMMQNEHERQSNMIRTLSRTS